METVEGLLVLPCELVVVDEALVGVKRLPLGLLALASEGEDVDGDAQDVGQTVQLAL